MHGVCARTSSSTLRGKPRVAPCARQGINRTKVSQAKRRHLGAGGFAEPGERPSGASGFCQFSVAEVIG